MAAHEELDPIATADTQLDTEEDDMIEPCTLPSTLDLLVDWSDYYRRNAKHYHEEKKDSKAKATTVDKAVQTEPEPVMEPSRKRSYKTFVKQQTIRTPKIVECVRWDPKKDKATPEWVWGGEPLQQSVTRPLVWTAMPGGGYTTGWLKARSSG
eukprot:TRINITY_DN50669_c0_g3_i1.p2 TRINITY_DN50669_c0_g3~~TRINITY_DN50669_c0_g3_i1.p2  ORF type:complete len:153 (+),score=29.10 TRINITY_DN50669_c0_g3_i1:216-674(+)